MRGNDDENILQNYLYFDIKLMIDVAGTTDD